MSNAFDLDDDAAAPHAPVAAPYLDQLNPEQRLAAETLDGPVLVLAGAGTGKTRVLTTRLAHLMLSGRARAGQVLAVTFTNKAAQEMATRVAGLIGHGVEGMWLGTFHAMGVRILRRHAERVGLKPNFTILDTDDQIRLLKQLIGAANIDDSKWPARVLGSVIQRWKDRGLGPEQIDEAEAGELANGRMRALYRAYQDRMETLNAVDFGDLLLHCLKLFTRDDEVLESYQERFRYILVDEYQDTNVAQYLWLRLLARRQRNICCVGDDDQSIYGWRGAEVGNILRFERDFPGARIIRLERNYRSSGHILGAASSLIAHNSGRLGKTLWTEAGAGEKVRLRPAWDGQEEARIIGEEIEALQRRGLALSNVAVLVRAGFQTRAFEERFLTIGLPYRVVGGPRFYERLEIRDAIAYFRVTLSDDDDLAFERILNRPKRGLGDATLRLLAMLARAEGISLFAAARTVIATDELGARQRAALRTLIDAFLRWRGALEDGDHVSLVETILEESGMIEMWRSDRSVEAPGRLENLKELVRAIGEFDGLAGFLEHVALVMDVAERTDEPLVSVMTLHSAKGLEFDTVFLPGWEEGLFPHQLALDQSGAAGLEEERRLAYVGLTRARRRADILCAANRLVYNQWTSPLPSRFIDEIDKAHIEAVSSQGLYRGYQGAATSPARRRSSGRAAGAVIEGEARRLPDAAAARGFSLGERVFHQKFGYGRITAVNGNRLGIAFDKAGAKTVIDSFVEPA